MRRQRYVAAKSIKIRVTIYREAVDSIRLTLNYLNAKHARFNFD